MSQNVHPGDKFFRIRATSPLFPTPDSQRPPGGARRRSCPPLNDLIRPRLPVMNGPAGGGTRRRERRLSGRPASTWKRERSGGGKSERAHYRFWHVQMDVALICHQIRGAGAEVSLLAAAPRVQHLIEWVSRAERLLQPLPGGGGHNLPPPDLNYLNTGKTTDETRCWEELGGSSHSNRWSLEEWVMSH